MNQGAVDQYLARCAVQILQGELISPWPTESLGVAEALVPARIAFHGIALLLAQASDKLDSWPAAVQLELRKQAGIQTFWEVSHRAAMAPLLDAFAAAGVSAVVTKGTALAYSVYDDPAIRRRGDTDILIGNSSRAAARRVLRSCGFRPMGDTKAFQESWECDTPMTFAPAVDVHWRINASAAASQMLERGLDFAGTVALDRLSPTARAIGRVDNLILTCINRSAHGTFGYHVGDTRLFEADRLIWAMDMHLMTSGFGPAQWQALIDRAALTGTAAMVRSGLAFASASLGVPVPDHVRAALAKVPDDHGLAGYFGTSTHVQRLRRDIAACDALSDKARVLRYVAFPSADFLQDRFPDAGHWPSAALHLRRWVEGAGKLLRGSS